MSLQGREFVCNRSSNVIYFICYSLTRARITVAYELVSMFVLCSIDVGMCAMCACDAQLHACARDMGACVTSSSTFIHFQSFSCCRFAMSFNPTVLACFSPLQFPLYLPPDVAKTYEIAETLVAYIRVGRLQMYYMYSSPPPPTSHHPPPPTTPPQVIVATHANQNKTSAFMSHGG